MRILLLSNMFPPFIMGGAEMAAHSLALWLAGKGHQLHVLTSAPRPEDAGVENVSPNYTIERRFFPSVYQIYQARPPGPVAKVLFHAHDHFNLYSDKIVTEVIERFQPEIVSTHNLQGIGYNALRAIGRSGVPCVQTLHDFGLICINMNRFKDGRECETHHLPCQFSARLKKGYFAGISKLSYWSPSAALLEVYRPFLAPHLRAEAIPLPLLFPAGDNANPVGGPLRVLYVGQVVPWKGVAFLLGALRKLANHTRFVLDVVGGGSSLDELKAEYAGCTWVNFRGKIPPAEVGLSMSCADLLVVPSLWFENAPLVISQAIQLGLPVFASHVGGLPELVREGVSGRLLETGNEGAWLAALQEVIADPALLAAWRVGAGKLREDFAVDRLGDRVLTLFQQTMHPEKNHAATVSR